MTYTIQIPMDYVVRVKVVKTVYHIPQLQKSTLEQDCGSRSEPAY